MYYEVTKGLYLERVSATVYEVSQPIDMGKDTTILRTEQVRDTWGGSAEQVRDTWGGFARLKSTRREHYWQWGGSTPRRFFNDFRD